jgi:hypothetical protein
MRRAGDEMQARAATFDAAVPLLRLALVPKSFQPPGDVAYAGPIDDTMELLALDAGESVRYVSETLLGRWGVSREQAFDVADRNSIAIPLDIRVSESQPALHTMAPRDGSPYVGALLRHLRQLDPAAMGMFGALVFVPNQGGLAYVTLDPSAELRMLLANVAVNNIKMAGESKAPIDKLPWWLRPDGTLVRVAFKFEDNIGVSGSHESRFEGVLVALAPLEMLPVAPWARMHMSPADYTRFAGCVMAASGITSERVSELGDGLALPVVAARCLTAPHGEWPALVAGHMAEARREIDVAEASLRAAVVDPASARKRLVAWLGQKEGANPKLITRPIGATGLSEVLALDLDGRWQALETDALPSLGEPAALFAAAEDAVARDLRVVDTLQLISGDAVTVEGGPSPTAAIPRLLALFPRAVGPAGALVAVGNMHHFVSLPLHDASAVLDLPSLIGLASGAAGVAAWSIPPTVFWVSPDRLEEIRIVTHDGLVTRIEPSTDLAGLVARLPAAPRRMPAGLDEILGPEGALRLYGLLHAEMLERLQASVADTIELTDQLVREMATLCRSLDPGLWRDRIAAEFEAVAAPRRELDRLMLARDYATVRPTLTLSVGRENDTGSELAQNVGGGLALYPVLGSGRRHRRVTHVMLERWGVDAERVRQDAAANTAAYPGLVDEPMYADQPLVRALGAYEVEMEAAGLFLHLRQPGTKHGFVVCITHGSAAHYIRLDDPGAPDLLPAFAGVLADVYRRADAANDAHSPWLFWLKPEGTIVPLFSVLGPLPQLTSIPEELRMVLLSGPAAGPYN